MVSDGETLHRCFQPDSSSAPIGSRCTPRGQVVTRFPGTRQEEEKQNKPERAATACGLHWKWGLNTSDTGVYTRSNTKRDVCMGVLKVSRVVISSFFCGETRCFHRGRKVSSEANGLLLCVGLQLGWGRGRTEAILTELKQNSSVLH